MLEEGKIDKTLFSNKKIAIVTNRAPVSPITRNNKTFIQRSIGGLVAALEPIVGEFDGSWFCTVSKNSKLAKASLETLPYSVNFLELSDTELSRYYEGYSNKQLWPIFHYLSTMCHFDESDWNTYKSVNEKMADLIVENIDEDTFVWVHDYHFMLLPKMLRERNPKLKVGFFLHTPFPNQELFRILLNCKELVQGLLGADLIGFHTNQYVEHFINAVKVICPEVDKESNSNTLICGSRKVSVKGFPISIDYDYIEERASSTKVQKKVERLKKAYNSDFIGVSVDRLDYTKGILERISSIERFFDKYPEYLERVTFVQVLVPSRTKVEAYQNLKREVDESIGRINGKFSKDAWRPIFYIYNTLAFDDLVAHYLLSDIGFVVPLRDGMNLVAKEYIASHVNNEGVLILSEFTGAAEELTDSMLVNPYQKDLVADSIKESIEMSDQEKALRMKSLRSYVQENNVYNWLNNFFKAFDEAIKKQSTKVTQTN